ncbi:hypothetical protein QJS04_geneDACA023034 [Acorus gramineus]|uniref:Uncharacterized protein n=1 Tax=Acorus gramineus TaxID=55184 RepID=A0AAV9A7S9_ACOGR|nr:hypothetical protein QJS04_geneDACA023034 [Acorus gramineus]
MIESVHDAGHPLSWDARLLSGDEAEDSSSPVNADLAGRSSVSLLAVPNTDVRRDPPFLCLCHRRRPPPLPLLAGAPPPPLLRGARHYPLLDHRPCRRRSRCRQPHDLILHRCHHRPDPLPERPRPCPCRRCPLQPLDPLPRRPPHSLQHESGRL